MKLRKFGDPILRKKSSEIEKIGEKELKIINEMLEFLHIEGGVGLAAPQIGLNFKMIVIDINDGKERKIFNPKIIEKSDELIQIEEGCLSIPGIYKKVERSEKITVEYLNEKNEKVIEKAEGFLARVFQHEVDHLEGKLFIDRISSINKRMISSKLSKIKRKTLKEIKKG